MGRWLTVDPLAEKYYHMSPYAFCGNNFVRYIDSDGKEPTDEEAARIAAHVYGNKTDDILSGGWRVSAKKFGVILADRTGLKSAIYERVSEGKVTEYVYATAGSEDWTAWQENLKQPIGLSKQYRNAATNARKISEILMDEELNFVGHSLGGGEAALNSLVTSNDNLKGRKAFTFNAAGVGGSTKTSENTKMFLSKISENTKMFQSYRDCSIKRAGSPYTLAFLIW